MAARELIEFENVLSLHKIKELLNQFCRTNSTLIAPRSIGAWIEHRHSKIRLFGISATAYRALTPNQQPSARQSAVDRFNSRFEAIFQRRHDCIHNCDRPKVSTQPISDTSVRKVIEDVDFLVNRSLETLSVEFTEYLVGLGFSGATRNRVCM